MTKQEMVRARLETATKKKAEAILKRLGLSHSAFINMSYHAVIETGGIPFSTRIPNAETIVAIEKGRRDHARGVLPSYTSTEELIKDALGESD